MGGGISMTDLLPQSIGLDPAPILPDQVGVDASSIDKNLRTVRQVQSTWRLPELPDEVAFDLVSTPGIDHRSLQGFLYGLESDLHGTNSAAPPIAPEVPRLTVQSDVGGFSGEALSGYDRFSSAISSLRSMPAPKVLDADATQRWKIRAIEAGKLAAPENGVVDGTWSPELYGIQRQMQYEDYDRRLRGDRFGAMPLTGKHGLLETLYDWTSPSGLMRTAVNLDLWWDAGAIGKEFSSWGDKWRKVGKSSNPLDFAKNLLDAVTGPVDDIVVPMFNMALLFTGLGAGVNYARLGATGLTAVEAANTWNFASKLYEVPKLGSVLSKVMPIADVAAAEKLGDASWMAQKLMKGGKAAQAVGGKMAAWRELPAVIGTRGVVQTGMRVGLVAQAEDRLLPGYQGGGWSLGDVPAVAEAADKVLRNQWATMVFEPLFTPYTIFKEGAFTGTLRDSGLWAVGKLGSTPGRMVAGALAGAAAGTLLGDDAGDIAKGAVLGATAAAVTPQVGDALAWIGGRKVQIPIASKLVHGLGRTMQLSQWERIGQDQKMSELFLKAVRHRMADSPEELKAFEAGVAEKGFLQSFADQFGFGGNVAEASAAMAYVTVSAAIDRTAALQAGATGAAKDSRAWFERFFLARNKLVAQLRTFDGDFSDEEVVLAVLTKESKSLRGLSERHRRYMRALEENPAPFADRVAKHNEQAALTLRQLLSPENLPLEGLDDTSKFNLKALFDASSDHAAPEALISYISDTLDTFGNWGKYHTATDSLNGMVDAGLFADARLTPVFSTMGAPVPLSFKDTMPEFITREIDDEFRHIVEHMHDNVFIDPTSAEALQRSGFYYNPMAREINPYRSRVTLMKADSVTKQELMQKADELGRTIEAYKALGSAKALRLADGTSLLDDPAFLQMSGPQINQILRDLGENMSTKGKAVRAVGKLARHMRDKGVEFTGGSIDNVLRNYLNDLDSDAVWSMRFGQGKAMFKSDGSAMSGIDALKARREELLARANRTAATIDHNHLLEQLAAKGGVDSDAYRQLSAYIDHIESQGYQMVYGQEFLMPNDLRDATGVFNDITEKHMNAMTLGNFFGRRHPAELALNVQQARARAIARNLSEVLGDTIGPDDPRVQRAIKDLYERVLDPALAENKSLLSNIRHETMLDKNGTAVKTSGQARSIQDLGMKKQAERVAEALVKAGWSDKEAQAIWRGIRQGRYAEWSDQGLYAIEAKLRSRNQIMDAMHVLGGTPNASRLKRSMKGAAVGALVGSMAGRAGAPEGDNGRGEALVGALKGAVVGGVSRAVTGFAFDKLEAAIDVNNWAKYGHIADELAAVRDRMRFSLSPFFDLSRYTEAFMLGQTAAPKRLEDGSRMVMPLNQSPKALRKSLVKQYKAQGLSTIEAQNAATNHLGRLADEWRSAAKGVFDVNELAETQHQFEEIGLFGFNPTQWMMSTFHHMREAGMDTEKAYTAVRDMYTYGTRSRSAFEQSVNFIFFPFSFQKKTAAHAAQWIADDMTRSVLIHDAYKAYELLQDHTGLNDWFEEHAPVLNRLQQLNMFAYGLSPGKLGGVNAPFVEFAVGDPLSTDPTVRGKGALFSLLSPFGVHIGEGQGTEFMKVIRRTIPALNDVKYMLEDLKSQGHVLFDPAHKTAAAQVRDGYDQWSEYKKGVEAAMKDAGASWYDLYNNPGMAPLLAEFQQKKYELERQFPAWADAKLTALGKQAELEQERQFRLNTVQFHPEEATPSDVMFYQFEQMLARKKQILDQYGITDWQEMAPGDFAQVRGVAIEMARQNPGFRLIWRKFYERTFGMIETSLA